MQPTEFPYELLQVLKLNYIDHTVDTVLANSIVRSNFISWIGEHDDFSNTSPLIINIFYKTRQLEDSINHESLEYSRKSRLRDFKLSTKGKIAKKFEEMLLTVPHSSERISKFFEETFSKPQQGLEGHITPDLLPTHIEYHELGLLTRYEYLELLILSKADPKKILSKSYDIIEKACTEKAYTVGLCELFSIFLKYNKHDAIVTLMDYIAKKLDSKQITEFFTFQRAEGNTILHNPHFLIIAMPLIEQYQIHLADLQNDQHINPKDTFLEQLNTIFNSNIFKCITLPDQKKLIADYEQKGIQDNLLTFFPYLQLKMLLNRCSSEEIKKSLLKVNEMDLPIALSAWARLESIYPMMLTLSQLSDNDFKELIYQEDVNAPKLLNYPGLFRIFKNRLTFFDKTTLEHCLITEETISPYLFTSEQWIVDKILDKFSPEEVIKLCSLSKFKAHHKVQTTAILLLRHMESRNDFTSNQFIKFFLQDCLEPLQYPRVLITAMPLIERYKIPLGECKLSNNKTLLETFPNKLYNLFRNNTSKINPENLALLLTNFTSENLKNGLLKNYKNAPLNSILHSWATLNDTQIPKLIFDKLEPSDLKSIFSKKNSDTGLTPLDDADTLLFLVPYIKKLTEGEIYSFMIGNKNDKTKRLQSISDVNAFKEILDLFSITQIFNLFFISKPQNENSNSFIVNVLNYLNTRNDLSKDELVHLFNKRNREGNTLLHKHYFYTGALPLISKFAIDISTLTNYVGLTPIDINEKWYFSPRWIASEKNRITIENIPEEVYLDRVQRLKKNVSALWEGVLKAYEGKLLPDTIFETCNKENGRIFSPNLLQWSEALQSIINKMETKEAWLGTPNGQLTKELHLFYSEQLINFEKLVDALLKRNNALHTAGYLTSITSVVFEGRCGRAYFSEIRQKSLDISDEQISREALFSLIPIKYLENIIANVIAKYHNGDVHYLRTYEFSAGLAQSIDDLSEENIQQFQQHIIKELNLSNLVKEFNAIIEPEEAEQWIKDQVPQNYGQEYLTLIHKLQTEEAELCNQISCRFSQININANMSSRLLELIASNPARQVASLINILSNGENLFNAQIRLSAPIWDRYNIDLKSAINVLIEAKSGQIDKEFIEHIKEYLKILLSQLRSQWIATSNLKEMKASGDAIEVLCKRLMAIIEFEKSLASFELNQAQHFEVLKAVTSYDSHMQDIVERYLGQNHLDITHNPAHFIFPSQTVEHARRLDFSKGYFKNRGQMALFILNTIGVIEENAIKQMEIEEI